MPTFSTRKAPATAPSLRLSSALLAIVVLTGCALSDGAGGLAGGPDGGTDVETPTLPGPDLGSSDDAPPLLGAADGITVDGPQATLGGWACQKGVAASVQVHLYRQTREGKPVFVLAAAADQPSEAAVGEACGASFSQYRFRIELPAGLRYREAGRALLAFAVKPDTPSVPLPSAAPLIVPPPTVKPTQIGMFTLGWHTLVVRRGIRRIQAANLPVLTVEDVLRDGRYQLADMLIRPAELIDPALPFNMMNFYYQERPADGFYCAYRRAPGDPDYYGMGDCDAARARAILRQQADRFVQADIDFVFTDSTNFSSFNVANEPFGYTIQARPFEVMLEEWAAYRKEGGATPTAAIWHTIPAGSDLHNFYLDRIYSNPEYEDLLFKVPVGGESKKVFFYVDPPDAARAPDPALIAEIEANRGRNDVVAIPMWALYPPGDAFWQDRWSFMSACMDGNEVTTTPGQRCGQFHTPASKVGSQIAVAPTYQLAYGSLPFMSPGRQHGMTLRKQWGQALAVRPDFITLASWNEYAAQPQTYTGPRKEFARSMGLEDDPNGDRLFVDGWGEEFSRDIEPTTLGGDALYQLTRSCIRVYRSGATACTDPNEACCQQPLDAQYNLVHSLTNATSGDHLLTVDTNERNALLGVGFREVCNLWNGPTRSCVDINEPLPTSGPFMLYTHAAGQSTRRPLYRCVASGRHFFSPQANCEGQSVEGPLGFFSTVKSSDTPRALRRCYSDAAGHIHALGFHCPAGMSEATLGYVR